LGGFEVGLKGTDQVGYPGGYFDPLGFAKGDFKEMQTKEIANGRLAMVAMLGFYAQAFITGKGPVDNWLSHIAVRQIITFLFLFSNAIVPSPFSI